MNQQGPPPDARGALLDAALVELTAHGAAGVGLRAVARRAGLSHAAPGYFFGDRAGMLTALAVRGFDGLAESLERVRTLDARTRLAALGDAYIDYGLANGALFDLMFARDLLRADAPELEAARLRSLAPLVEVNDAASGTRLDALMSWGLVHGLVALVRQGAIQEGAADPRAVAHDITARFAARTT